MPDVFESIEAYLAALKSALQGADPALVQDALWDAEAHLSSGLAASREQHPELSEAAALAALQGTFGSPAEVAEAYRERELVVSHALRAQPVPTPGEPDPSLAPLAPWPSFFGVLRAPKAYNSLLYLLLSLATGIFFFTWAIAGISLSLGLFILIIGIPFAIAFLGSVRMLALVEGRLVEALLDVRMPRRPSLLPEAHGWMERLKNLLKDGHTWTSLGYLLLHLPLGILSFTLMVTGLALSLGLMAAPIVAIFIGLPSIELWNGAEAQHPVLVVILAGLSGGLLLLGTLHLALALGRFQGFLAKHMLVRY